MYGRHGNNYWGGSSPGWFWINEWRTLQVCGWQRWRKCFPCFLCHRTYLETSTVLLNYSHPESLTNYAIHAKRSTAGRYYLTPLIFSPLLCASCWAQLQPQPPCTHVFTRLPLYGSKPTQSGLVGITTKSSHPSHCPSDVIPDPNSSNYTVIEISDYWLIHDLIYVLDLWSFSRHIGIVHTFPTL